MKTILEPTSATIIEKKSKFIGNLFYVASKEEAQQKIKEIQKQYYDAKHHCFAYRIQAPNGLIEKTSDDGEPSGTAGVPILQTLIQHELQNVLLIVTRYFGGILLGTGGLLRAYQSAATETIKNANLVHEVQGLEIEVKLEYSQLQYFEYYCQKHQITIQNISYHDSISCLLEVTNQEKEQMMKQMQEGILKIQNFEIVKEKNIKKNIEK